MKTLFPILFFFSFNIQAQHQDMKKQFLSASIGEIAVYVKEVKNTTPIIFLHGVYFDHHLWNYQTSRIHDRTVISIDMPLHGDSQNISKDWNLENCADMLLEVIDALEIPKVIAVGHSWGSMTILRAAHKKPELFQLIGLCNMPFEAATTSTKWQFSMQHLILPFRDFYAKQVAKAMYGKKSLKQNPELLEYLVLSMSKLTNKAVKQTDKKVILQAEDATQLIEELKVEAFALKGKEDYVPISPFLEYKVVKGGHVSPLEVPEKVYSWLKEVIE